MKIIGYTVGTNLPKPNLMQNDPKKGDYVHGKEEFVNTIGGGSSTVNIMEEQTLTGFQTSSYGFYATALMPAPFFLAVGEKYTVVWGENEYVVEGVDASAVIPNGVAIGDLRKFGYPGNGEPFVIVYDGAMVTFFSLFDEEPTNHTVRIYQIDNMATEGFVKAYVNQYISEALGGDY